MSSPSHSRPACLVATAILCVLYYTSSCSSNAPSSNALAPGGARSNTTFNVVLIGPWAIAPDPDNPSGILAIAPNAQGHGLLYVQGRNYFTLLPGQYTLNFANVSTSGQVQYSPLNEPIAMKTLQAVQGTTGSKRYALHLPGPNGKGESAAFTSRVDENGNLPVSTTINENPYTTEVSLEYAIVDPNSVKLTGNPDPLPSLPPLPTPIQPTVTASVTMNSTRVIRIGTEPSTDESGSCSNQSKMAFRELVGLLKLKKTIDFPNYGAGCQQCDPQGANPQPCSSTAALHVLDTVKALVNTTPPSSERRAVLEDTNDSEALISGKTRGDQKDLVMKLSEVQRYLGSFKPNDPILGKLDEIISIMSSPTRDCKTPLINLTIQQAQTQAMRDH